MNFFRKVGADTKRRNMSCDVHAKWLASTGYSFDGLVNFPSVDIPSFEPKDEGENKYSDEEIEHIAESVREQFGLGLGQSAMWSEPWKNSVLWYVGWK